MASMEEALAWACKDLDAIPPEELAVEMAAIRRLREREDEIEQAGANLIPADIFYGEILPAIAAAPDSDVSDIIPDRFSPPSP